MPLPATVRDSAVRHVEMFCENRVPAEARSGVRLEHTAEIAGDPTGIFWG